MKWNKLENSEQLDLLINESAEKPQVIFKHSIRCSISSMMLSRFERSHESNAENNSEHNFHYLDLINHRNISNLVEEKLEVRHQSPQVIILFKGESIYDASHIGINYDEVVKELKSVSPVS